jgi:hypothetical protein
MSGCAVSDTLWGFFGRYHSSPDRPVDPKLYDKDTPETRKLHSEEENIMRKSDTPFDGQGYFPKNQ